MKMECTPILTECTRISGKMLAVFAAAQVSCLMLFGTSFTPSEKVLLN
jgi:hypothetical protein